MYLSYDVLGMLGCIVLIILVIMSFKLVHAQASEGMLDLLLRKLGEQKCHDILDDLKEDIVHNEVNGTGDDTEAIHKKNLARKINSMFYTDFWAD